MKFTYLDFTARGEPTRLALAVAGVNFEDNRLSLHVLGKLTPSPEIPFGTIPVLEVDGEVYAESSALLRYAGNLGGLYPKCEKAAMKVDMVLDAVEVPLSRAIEAALASNKKEARAVVLEEVIPRYFGAIETMYASKDGPYLLGSKLSIADLKVAVVFQTLSDGGMDAIAPVEDFKDYPLIQAATKAVFNEEKVVEWYQSYSKKGRTNK